MEVEVVDTQFLIKLLARAIVDQARRQADQKSAVPVLAHQDGDASKPPAERNRNAIQL